MSAPVSIAEAAQGLSDAYAKQGKAIESLQRFLSREIAESERRLAPCVCGHIKMFCACLEKSK